MECSTSRNRPRARSSRRMDTYRLINSTKRQQPSQRSWAHWAHTHAPNVPERVFRFNKERFARWSIPGEFAAAAVLHDTRTLVELCCRGGWPETFDDNYTIAQHVAREYLQSIYEQSAPAHGKNPQITERLVQSIARNLGQAPTLSTTLQDMNGFAVEVKFEKTLSEYLEFLKSIFLIQEIPG